MVCEASAVLPAIDPGVLPDPVADVLVVLADAVLAEVTPAETTLLALPADELLAGELTVSCARAPGP